MISGDAMKFTFSLLLVLAVAGCGPSKRAVVQPQYLESAPANFPIVPGVANADDIGLFLAGKPVRHGAELSRMQQTVEYQAHQKEIGPAWRQVVNPRIRKMENWGDTQITPVVGTGGTVDYPFGGPDLLHISALFPTAKTYVLMGLEPPGEVPALESMPAGEVLGALVSFRQATKTQFITGYFITKDMRSDLDRSVLRGVTPIFLATVSLMGGQVLSVQSISAGGNPGVEMKYYDAAGMRHTAYYVSGDLSNGGFKPAYQQWLASLGSKATYFKAASYLMHDNGFSKSRDFFLSQTGAVLQDDSGIPLRNFAPDAWTFRFFGTYNQPIELFAKHQQDDLRQAFLSNPVGPLTFPSGYQYDYHKANLMLATKR